MVQVILFSNRGNGLKYFPFHGLLGLTPVRIEGVVRTKLEADLKPVAAKSLTVAVRCYETRLGRLGSVQSVKCLAEYSQVMWDSTRRDGRPSTASSTSSTSSTYTDLGDFEAPFRITIPPNAVGPSVMSFPEYKVSWRIEAVLEHAPFPGIGSRQVRHMDLSLVRHDVPSPLLKCAGPATPLSASPSSSSSSLPLCSSHAVYKGRFPIFHYSLAVQSDPIGPEDFVSVPLVIKPLDPSFAVKSATINIERRMYFVASGVATTTPAAKDTEVSFPSDNTSGSLTPTPSNVMQTGMLAFDTDTTPLGSVASVLPTPSSSLCSVMSSGSLSTIDTAVTPATSQHPLIPAARSSSSQTASSSSSSIKASTNVFTNTITSAEVSGSLFARTTPFSGSRASLHDPDTWSKTFTLQWPAVQSSARWSIGETMHTDSVAIRFVVCVRVVVALSTGVETMDLDFGEELERELLVVRVNDTQRSCAQAKYNDAQASKKSKSQSPHRRTRDIAASQLPSPPGSPPQHRQSSSALHSDDSRRSRRTQGYGPAPPPSAPPLTGSASVMAVPTLNRKSGKPSTPRPVRSMRRPHTSAGPSDVSISVSPGRGGRYEGLALNGNTRHLPVTPLPSVGDGDVQDWEAELAQIELRSRRSSANMLGVRERRPQPSATV